jgi:integrase
VFASLDAFTANDVRSFIAGLTSGEVTGRKVGAPTVNRHLAVLKGFMSWARDSRRTVNEADTEIPMLREDHGQRLPRELKPAHWRAILAELDARWRAAAKVQLGAGLRYGEVAALQPGHIHPAALHVELAKGRRARTVPASARTVRAARRLLALGGVPDDEGSQFNHRLAVAARRSRTPVVTTHAFRHTYACHTLRALLRAGQGLPELQARMGHASIRTTEVYLRAIRAGGGQRQVVGAPL